MRIAIITCGMLPIPAVQGGAVENLIDFYLEHNDKERLHDITVYSPWHPKVKTHPALKSDVNRYVFIDVTSLRARIARRFYGKRHRGEYYNHFIEYYFEKVFAHLKKQNYDIILLENSPGHALKLSQRGYHNLMLHLHNDLLNADSRQHDVIFSSLSKILTVSDFVKGRVSTIHPSSKIRTVYNGIDLAQFHANATGAVKRKDVGFSDEDFVMVYSGRINPEKGISELIDATALLLKRIPSLRLLILGSSFFNDAKCENAFILSLREKAKSIEDKIFFTGFVPYPQVSSYLHLADIAVLPSMWEEPFGLTIVEAMAVGLPLVTTRSGGIPEICEGVATIVERHDIVNNLVSAILDLYEHPEKRQQMAAASVERAKQFDKDTYARSIFQALEPAKKTRNEEEE
ncbi:MAG: glycosyltransferase family 4 protein [Bacteroidaceae bacterium]|nr:glycosyltransferase family 4 protein [Bacteroidaceae bacterium]